MPSTSPASAADLSVAIPAIRQRPLHFHPAAGFNVFDSATLYPTLQLISEPDTGHALSHCLSSSLVRVYIRSLLVCMPTKSSPYIWFSCLTLSFSLFRALPLFLLRLYLQPFSFSNPVVTSLCPPGHCEANQTPRLFQTHFNSLHGSTGTEWRPTSVLRCSRVSVSSFPHPRDIET